MRRCNEKRFCRQNGVSENCCVFLHLSADANNTDMGNSFFLWKGNLLMKKYSYKKTQFLYNEGAL